MILNGEPELEDVPDNLICPVCLDLLHDPFETIPCKHVFCETCLRRLGMKSAMNTSCPLCRTRIVICLPEKNASGQVRESFPELYAKRKNIERGTNIYDFPLPWKPGWRSLMKGKPFGGNTFKGDLRHFPLKITYPSSSFLHFRKIMLGSNVDDHGSSSVLHSSSLLCTIYEPFVRFDCGPHF